MAEVRSGKVRFGVLASMVLAAAIAVTAVAAPAEAARRKARSPAGGGYNPPYSAMVVDANTGRTLYAESEDALRHPASITKVMTLYLLFEQLDRGKLRLDSELNVSDFASRQAPSKLGLRPGSTIEVEDAIRALVTKSANDVAVTVAENIGGSEDAFAEMMTRKARELGMTRTVYRNASGLPDPEQVTTARDLVTLGRAIQDRFPRYYPYFSTRTFAYRGSSIRNHNRLLGRVDGMDGIKTGYTRMSGFNLLTSIRTEGRHVVAVVLGGRSAASRDMQMASLLQTYTGRAYAGGRTAPAVAESDPAPEPAVVAAAQVPATPVREAARTLKVAAYSDDDQTTTASLPRVKVIEPSAARPVVASAAGGASTTTPSSSGMKWVAGPAGKTPAAGGLTKVARLDADPAPLAKVEAKVDAKMAVRPADKTERPRSASSGWIIQLGATDDEDKAKDILDRARSKGRGVLAKAEPFTEKVKKGSSTLYRARFSGFDEGDAQVACKALQKTGFSCFAARGG
jgi:D-alanyl-D-alanine carboxypeptidase